MLIPTVRIFEKLSSSVVTPWTVAEGAARNALATPSPPRRTQLYPTNFQLRVLVALQRHQSAIRFRCDRTVDRRSHRQLGYTESPRALRRRPSATPYDTNQGIRCGASHGLDRQQPRTALTRVLVSDTTKRYASFMVRSCRLKRRQRAE